MRPVLIVLDTLARCFLSGDENSSMHMGELMEGVRKLQEATGATVVLAHHTGKPSKDARTPMVERGSSALRAAADVMIRVVQEQENVITITCDKAKDEEEAKPLKLRLKKVHLGERDGREISSCVLESMGKDEEAAECSLDFGLPGHLRSTLVALADQPGRSATSGAWEAASGRKERTYQDHRRKLVAGGWVEEFPPHSSIYRLTSQGVVTAMAVHPHGMSVGPQVTAATATPPWGVQAAAVAASEPEGM